MSKQERLHRQDPERSEPIRNLTGYLRNSRSWGESPSGAEHEQAGGEGENFETIDDVLTHGVNLGYKIIDEHIRQGRHAAETLRNGRHFGGEKVGDGDINALVSRLLSLTKDAGALCYDSLDLVLRSPRLLSGLAGRGEDSHADSGHPRTQSVAESNISIEIASKRRAQVTLNLPPRPHYTPLVHALHAADPAFPPLTGVSFRTTGGEKAPLLLVEIPDGQPPATYTGVVVDKETNEPAGTLVVRVLP